MGVYCLMGIEFFKMESVKETDCENCYTKLWMHLIPLDCTGKNGQDGNFMLYVFYQIKFF